MFNICVLHILYIYIGSLMNIIYLYSSYKNIFAPERHLPHLKSVKMVYFFDLLILVVGNIAQNEKWLHFMILFSTINCFHGAINYKLGYFCRSYYNCKQTKPSLTVKHCPGGGVNDPLSMKAALPLGLTGWKDPMSLKQPSKHRWNSQDRNIF